MRDERTKSPCVFSQKRLPGTEPDSITDGMLWPGAAGVVLAMRQRECRRAITQVGLRAAGNDATPSFRLVLCHGMVPIMNSFKLVDWHPIWHG